MTTRGLGNTTVREGVLSGISDSEVDAQRRLGDALAMMKVQTDTGLSGDQLQAQMAMDTQGLGLRTTQPQNRLDFMERRTDAYPDLAQATQLAMMSGQASGAVSGNPYGGYQWTPPGGGMFPPGGGMFPPGGGGGGGGGPNQGGGGYQGGVIPPGGGYGGYGPQYPPGSQQGLTRQDADGRWYRWNGREWVLVQGDGSGETPTEDQGLPTLPEQGYDAGSAEGAPLYEQIEVAPPIPKEDQIGVNPYYTPPGSYSSGPNNPWRPPWEVDPINWWNTGQYQDMINAGNARMGIPMARLPAPIPYAPGRV